MTIATDSKSVNETDGTAGGVSACGTDARKPPGVYADSDGCSLPDGGDIAEETHAQGPSVAESTRPPKRGRAGAPAGNKNAMRHGLRCGSLTKADRDIANVVSILRQHLENAVVRQHGEVSILHAAYIQSCTRHEMRAMLVQKWLRGEGAALPVLDRLPFLKQISDASDQRDRCLEKLGLNRSERPLWGEAFTTPQASPAADPTATTSEPTNAQQAQSTEAAA